MQTELNQSVEQGKLIRLLQNIHVDQLTPEEHGKVKELSGDTLEGNETVLVNNQVGEKWRRALWRPWRQRSALDLDPDMTMLADGVVAVATVPESPEHRRAGSSTCTATHGLARRSSSDRLRVNQRARGGDQGGSGGAGGGLQAARALRPRCTSRS